MSNDILQSVLKITSRTVLSHPHTYLKCNLHIALQSAESQDTYHEQHVLKGIWLSPYPMCTYPLPCHPHFPLSVYNYDFKTPIVVSPWANLTVPCNRTQFFGKLFEEYMFQLNSPTKHS